MDKETLPIPLVQLDEDLPQLGYAYAGDAGIDLRSSVDCLIQPFERVLVPCGISIAIPAGYAGLVVPRSGLAIKHGISVVNAPGLIDSNYRGEVKAILVNLDKSESFKIEKGDRIAQLVIVKVENVAFELVDGLESSVRGDGGFGSSGKR